MQLITFNTNLYTEKGRFDADKATTVNSRIAQEADLAISMISTRTTDINDLSVMRSIVMAIEHMSSFKLYNDQETILLNVKTAKTMLSRTSAIEKLLEDEEDLFWDDFIDAIGDLFDLTASTVSKQESERRRMLQDEAMRQSITDLY